MEEEKVYYKLTRSEQNVIKMIEQVTTKNFDDYDILGNFMPMKSVFYIMEDLLDEIYSLHDLIDEMKEKKEEEQGDEVEEMKIREQEK